MMQNKVVEKEKTRFSHRYKKKLIVITTTNLY